MRAILGFLAFVIMTAPAFAAEMGDDGLYKPDWFSLTFKDVGEDLAAAREEGKRLVLIFEQRGCVYCRKMHEVVLADPQVRDYIKANYKVVQYNLFGDEEVTDLDGEVLTEKKAARKWGVVFTPTVVFLPEDVTESTNVGKAAVSVMPGGFGKMTTLHMYEWVVAKGYEGDEHFQKYHARRLEEDGLIGQSLE
jgi:thioredoxin-related protein